MYRTLIFYNYYKTGEEKMAYVQPAVFKDKIAGGGVFVVIAHPGKTTAEEVVALATKVGALEGEGANLKCRIDFRNNVPYIGWTDESQLYTQEQLESLFDNFKPLTVG
mgnify:CR=1 FL=1